jgi:hypothetical protein
MKTSQVPDKKARQSVLAGCDNQLAVVKAKQTDQARERTRVKKGKEAAAARVKKTSAQKKARKDEDANVRANSAKNMKSI